MQVLIVMADQNAATALSSTLEQQGFACQIAEGGFYALTMLERYQPGAVVCSEDVVDMSGFDLYDIVRSDANLDGVRFLLLSGNSLDSSLNQSDVSLPADASADRIAQVLKAAPAATPSTSTPSAPAQSSTFRKRIASARQGNQVNGTLEVLTLFDLVMSLVQNGRSGTLFLLMEEEEGSIVLHEGKVIHALFKELSGEKALKQIFIQAELHNDTEFLFESGTEGPPGEVTIKRSVKEMLLHVAVELDNLRNAATESR